LARTFAFAATFACVSAAASQDLPQEWAAQRDRSILTATDSVPSAAAPSLPAEGASVDRPVYGEAPNYILPIYEIVGFNLLLNLFDRNCYGDDCHSNLSSIRRNLHSSWVVDSDPFRINQLAHPYQGLMYFGFARSAGVDYWKSLAYSFGGSAMWEIAGETTPPSRNDLINTGLGGSFVGEALFRLANLLLEQGNIPPCGGRSALP
jgi:hypothetical protein